MKNLLAILISLAMLLTGANAPVAAESMDRNSLRDVFMCFSPFRNPAG